MIELFCDVAETLSQNHGCKSLREPNIKGKFFLVERVSHQPNYQINKEVKWTAMAGMLDLRDIFQLVVDCFNDRAFTQRKCIKQRQQLVFHVVTYLGDELYALFP